MNKQMISAFEDGFHEPISPLPDDSKTVNWSVIILAYNCSEYLPDTFDSILNQDPGKDKMEILVVDDFSQPDSIPELIEKFGRGRIQYIRQKMNVGKSKNYATGLLHSRGKFIHILHGDDRIHPGFYEGLYELFQRFPDAGAAFCQSNYINSKNLILGVTGKELDRDGILEGWDRKITISQRIQPPSIVVKREVYEQVGGYDNRLKYFEDWEMYNRISRYYKVAFTPEILADYRVHEKSSSQKSSYRGERLKTQKEVIRIIDSYLDPKTIASIRPQRNQEQAQYIIRMIPTAMKNRDLVGYLRMVKGILGFSWHPKILYHLLYFTIKWKTVDK
jgi:glycosyltransferase involved in cell wall biosynthesis